MPRSATSGPFRDGKITKFQQYVDTAQLRAVMGAS